MSSLSAAAPAPRGFVRFAWAVLAYNLLVILWGAYVRASGAGAGCGDHWPLCNGVVVPRAPSVETLIELTHRVTSGLALLGVVGAYLWTRRFAAPTAPVRRAAFWAVVFMLIEAAVGAGLVLFEYVAHDQRLGRALWHGAHLLNTLVLVAWITLTAWFATGAPAPRLQRGVPLTGMLTALGALLLVGLTGAIAALGDTLFPSTSLREGIARDFSPAAHLLVRLRVLHPTLAVTAGAACAFVAWWAMQHAATARARGLGRAAAALIGVQWVVGLTNLLLLAPIWLQLVHLLVADLTWIAFVLLGAAWLAEAPATAPVPAVAPRAPSPAAARR